jgi:hypothetical protein
MANTNLNSELLALETQYWNALKDNDVETAIRLTDDECIVTGAQGAGRVDARTLRAMLSKATYTLHDFELKDFQAVEVRDGVAVAAYTVHEVLTVDGKRVEFDAADASTWVQRDGRWRCALHTESILGDPFGRDRRA